MNPRMTPKYKIVNKIDKWRRSLTISKLVDLLRESGIKGKKNSFYDNPVVNLILYRYVEDVHEVILQPFTGGRHKELICIKNPAWDKAGQLPAGTVFSTFLQDFNDGKYPEFEE